MNLDPNTKVRSLVAALPSSAVVLRSIGIADAEDDERTIQQACSEASVAVEEFLSNLGKIDWNADHDPLGAK